MHMPAACAAHTDLARPQQKHKLAQLAGHDLMPDLALIQLRQGVTCHVQSYKVLVKRVHDISDDVRNEPSCPRIQVSSVAMQWL